MKVKLSKQQIDAILADPEKAQEAGVKTNDPWWVIALSNSGGNSGDSGMDG